MLNESNIGQRALAVFGAIAMTMTMLVSYFSTPEVQAVSGMLA